MLESNVEDIPDLHFAVDLLISDPPYIASRLSFDCTPKEKFLGLAVNGKRVSFTENVSTSFEVRRSSGQDGDRGSALTRHSAKPAPRYGTAKAFRLRIVFSLSFHMSGRDSSGVR
jgi:hypothetical protein